MPPPVESYKMANCNRHKSGYNNYDKQAFRLDILRIRLIEPKIRIHMTFINNFALSFPHLFINFVAPSIALGMTNNTMFKSDWVGIYTSNP